MIVRKISRKDTENAIEECAAIIRGGGLVSFPTETFYGIGVRYDDERALGRLNSLKNRGRGKALPLIVGNEKLLQCLAVTPFGLEKELIQKFWPGPLTLLLEAKKNLPDIITAGTGKIAVRVPGQSFALDLARRLEFPVTATSANISGMPPADSAEMVLEYFGKELDLIIDAGKTPGGKPSTIVHVKDNDVEILRQGAVPDREIISAVKSYYMNKPSTPFTADKKQ